LLASPMNQGGRVGFSSGGLTTEELRKIFKD